MAMALVPLLRAKNNSRTKPLFKAIEALVQGSPKTGQEKKLVPLGQGVVLELSKAATHYSITS